MKTLITLAISIFTLSNLFAQSGPTTSNYISTVLEIEDGEAILCWDMKKESNTAYFIVEASTNSRDFNPIATVQAAGYSFKPTHYALDGLAHDSVVKYRVIMVAMDGQRVCANVGTNDSEMDQLAASNR